VSGDDVEWSGPSLVPKYTPRSTFHRVNALTSTWAFSIRGPWHNEWQEFKRNDNDDDGGEFTTLTHGRVKVA
jgi:hypothetical protein